jgi:CheY-like chemotaxis protein
MKKVLFIEDEEDQIMMVRMRMEAYGYDFVSAVNGVEGLKKVYEEKPDLILMDIVMPKMNGYEVCDCLKKDPTTRDIPIIVVTASGIKDLEARCVALGVEEIIYKPYESSYLVERVAFHMGK